MMERELTNEQLKTAIYGPVVSYALGYLAGLGDPVERLPYRMGSVEDAAWRYVEQRARRQVWARQGRIP